MPRHRFFTMFALVVAGEAIFGLPFLVSRVFRPTLLDVFGITNLQLGTAFSVYGVVAMVAYLPGGPLADRFSARRMMAIALCVSAVGGVFYATLPSIGGLKLLFGFWGLTTILLFWAALIRATRVWGGENGQGKAFGILDGGRGLLAAVLATVTVGVFGALLPEDAATASLAQRADALKQVIWIFTGMTVIAGGAGLGQRAGRSESEGGRKRYWHVFWAGPRCAEKPGSLAPRHDRGLCLCGLQGHG